MTKIIPFKPRAATPAAAAPAPQPAPRLELPAPRLIDAILQRKSRAKLVEWIVDTSRELPSRADRVEFWLALVLKYRRRCAAEGADWKLIDRAVKLLTDDVRTTTLARIDLAKRAAELDPPLRTEWMEQPGDVVPMRFPGEDDATYVDLLVRDL